MKNIGYLGLGVMGYGMTSNLIRKVGDDTVVWGYDPVETMRQRFADMGGKAVTDAKELYRACEIIFMCLPTNALVKTTIQEIMDTAKPGHDHRGHGIHFAVYHSGIVQRGLRQGVPFAGFSGQRRRGRRHRRHAGDHVRRRSGDL